MKPSELLKVLPEVLVADFWQNVGSSYVYRGIWTSKENKFPLGISVSNAEIIKAEFKSPTRIAIYLREVENEGDCPHQP